MISSPRKIKEQKAADFRDRIQDSQAIVLAEYKGLTVSEMEELRGKLREVGSRMSIIKNTLAKVALNEAGISDLDEDLLGQIAFIFSNEDAVSGPKVAADFARAHDVFKLISGHYAGNRLDLDELKALASMPSKEELRSKLVGILMAPLADLVGTLTAPLQELAGTLDAKVAKMNEEG